MRPRRTHSSNRVFTLPGGTEDNDLWIEQTPPPDPVMVSVWEPTAEERALIAVGQNIEVAIHGNMHPPLQLGVTSVPIGKAPADGAS